MILLLISLAVFTAYVLTTRIVLGPLKSISISYYSIKYPYLFTLALMGFSIPLWVLSGTWLIFAAVTGICLVGTAPMFQSNETTKWIHMVSASAGITLGFIQLFAWGYWFIPAAYILFFLYEVKDRDFGWIWRIEVAAFACIWIGVLLNTLNVMR